MQPVLTSAVLQHLPLRVQMQPGSAQLKSIVYRFIKISAIRDCLYPVIPDTSYALYFSPHCAMLSVGLKRPQTLRLPASGDYYGIHFYPGALHTLFPQDFSEIGGEVADAHFLPLDFIDQLQQIFYARGSFRQKVSRCESLMRQRLLSACVPTRQSQTLQAALSYLYAAAGNVRIEKLAKYATYSERQLNRLFQLSTGLSAKTFANIIRLQFLLQRCNGVDGVSLARLLDHGYYDQSHFRKDYRRFLLAP